MLQWKPVEDETSTVTVTVAPPAISSVALPSSSVNVCATLSLFVMVTSVGPDTVIVFGSNPEAVDSIVIVVAPLGEPVSPVVPVAAVVPFPPSSLPQAVSTIETARSPANNLTHFAPANVVLLSGSSGQRRPSSSAGLTARDDRSVRHTVVSVRVVDGHRVFHPSTGLDSNPVRVLPTQAWPGGDHVAGSHPPLGVGFKYSLPSPAARPRHLAHAS